MKITNYGWSTSWRDTLLTEGDIHWIAAGAGLSIC
jgi:hypothetical protein